MKVVGSSAGSKARTNSIDEGVSKRTFMVPDEGKVKRSSSNSSILTDEAMGENRSSSSSTGRGVSSNAYANGASRSHQEGGALVRLAELRHLVGEDRLVEGHHNVAQGRPERLGA